MLNSTSETYPLKQGGFKFHDNAPIALIKYISRFGSIFTGFQQVPDYKHLNTSYVSVL